MTELEEKEFNRKFDSWLDSEYDKYCEAEFDKYCQTLEQEKPKQLTQDVFANAPEWVRSAAFDQDGHAWGYACKASDLSVLNGGHHATVHVKNSPLHLGSGYPGDEWWEESAIDRE